MLFQVLIFIRQISRIWTIQPYVFFSTQCICCEACRLTIHALFHSLPLVQRQERQSTHSDFPHHSAGKGICMPVQSCPAESGSAIKGMHDRLILLFSDRRHTQYSRKQGSSRRRQNKALEAGLPAIYAHYSPYGSTGIPSLLKTISFYHFFFLFSIFAHGFLHISSVYAAIQSYFHHHFS